MLYNNGYCQKFVVWWYNFFICFVFVFVFLFCLCFECLYFIYTEWRWWLKWLIVWFSLRVFCLDDAGCIIVLGEESVVPVGSISFYFIFSGSIPFGDFILHIYSCILFMLVDGRVHLAVEQRQSRPPIILVATASSWSCRNCCWVTVGNADMELVAWRAFASSHKFSVFVETSVWTEVK